MSTDSGVFIAKCHEIDCPCVTLLAAQLMIASIIFSVKSGYYEIGKHRNAEVTISFNSISNWCCIWFTCISCFKYIPSFILCCFCFCLVESSSPSMLNQSICMMFNFIREYLCKIFFINIWYTYTDIVMIYWFLQIDVDSSEIDIGLPCSYLDYELISIMYLMWDQFAAKHFTQPNVRKFCNSM